MFRCRSRYDRITEMWCFDIMCPELGVLYSSGWHYTTQEDAESAGKDADAFALQSVMEAIKEIEVKAELKRIGGSHDGNTKRSQGHQDRKQDATPDSRQP